MWLGIAFNSTEFSFKTSEKRSISIKNLINKLLRTPYATPRQLAKLCGKIISTKIVLGNVVQLKTRRLYKLINESYTWDSFLLIKVT